MSFPRRKSREGLCLLGLLAAVLAVRLPFLMHGLDELDSANFALSVVRFDVLNHQPHPPGQWVYVRLVQALHALAGNELFTLSLASVLGGTLALVPYYLALRQIVRPAEALAAAALTAFAPGVWITSLRMVSDPVASLFVYGTVAALLAGLTCPRWLLGGMALCGVALGTKQTAVYFLAPFVLAVNVAVVRRDGPRRPLLGGLCLVAAVAVWLLPTVGNAQGWDRYVAACRALQLENYRTESLLLHLSATSIQAQWEHDLVQPWGSAVVAALLLPLAALGLLLFLGRGGHGRLFALFGVTVVLYAFCFLYRFNKYWLYSVPVCGAFAAAGLFHVGAALARCWRQPALRGWVPGLVVALVTAANACWTFPLLSAIAHFRAPPQAALESLRKLPGIDPRRPLLLTDDVTVARELIYFGLKGQVELLNLSSDLRAAAAALDAGRKVYLLSPCHFDPPADTPDTFRLLARYVWRTELYAALQGRPDLRELSLYEVSSLSSCYGFASAVAPPPLLGRGVWPDGWCAADFRFLLPCDETGTSHAVLRFTVPPDAGYRFPYRLTCQVAGGDALGLIADGPGSTDFLVPLPGRPGARVAEVHLLAPQTTRSSQRDPRSTDDRARSVHLDAAACVTPSRPLLLRREKGWYAPPAAGANPWNWTGGDADLSIMANDPGMVVLEADVASCTADNTLEMLVDGRSADLSFPLGAEWSAQRWLVPTTAGVHRVTLRSRNAAVPLPGNDGGVAFRVRNLRARLEPD